MLRRRPAYPYLRLKDWADSGEALHLRCATCAAEAGLRPAALIARHGWHGDFAKAVGGIACVECGGRTELVHTHDDRPCVERQGFTPNP